MITLQFLYNIVEEDRLKILGFFKKIDQKHFYNFHAENTWSPELIFRHLLMNIQWILDKLPNKVKLQSNLTITLEEEVSDQTTLEEIMQEFTKFSAVLKEELSKLTQEQEEEIIETYRGKMQRRIYLVRLINHEHRHLGQLQWLLKRSTGWTDKEIYS